MGRLLKEGAGMSLIDIVVALFMLPLVFIWFMIDMYDTLFGRH